MVSHREKRDKMKESLIRRLVGLSVHEKDRLFFALGCFMTPDLDLLLRGIVGAIQGARHNRGRVRA